MDMSKMQELMELQKKAAAIQKELETIHIEAEVDGVVVTIDGKLEIINVKFEDPSILKDQTKTEKAILEATNKWIKKAQEVAAQKMQWVMGDMWLNLPGM